MEENAVLSLEVGTIISNKMVETVSRNCSIVETVLSISTSANDNDGLDVLFTSATNRGKFLILTIMKKYTEINLRYCLDENRVKSLKLLEKKVDEIFGLICNAPWNDDYALSYRYDFDHVASEVYELLQSGGNYDLLDCILLFMALCVGKDASCAPTYLSFIDLCDALRISNNHINILEMKVKSSVNSSEHEKFLVSEQVAATADDLRSCSLDEHILRRKKSTTNAFWRKLGLKTSPNGVTCTRNPEIYRVQISLRKGNRFSHNIAGLEDALFLYDILLHLSELFNEALFEEKSNYRHLNALGMVRDKAHYSQKLLEKVRQQFSLAEKDVNKIELYRSHSL